MSDKWTLVTGANGFIGSALVKALIARGDHVKALVRSGANLAQLEGLPPSQLRIAVGDLRIVDRVYAAMTACDRVYHVAAQVAVDETKREQIVRSSVEGTEATLEAARRAGLEKIVVTSSIFALGATEQPMDMDESQSFNVVHANAYAEAKHKAEAFALERAGDGLPVVVVNPGMVIGAGDFKPTTTGQMLVDYLKTSPAFKVPIAPGGRNFVALDDVVQGHILAMEKGRLGERYILGGENLTHREFYTRLSDLTGLAEPGADLTAGKAKMAAFLSELSASWSGKSPTVTKKLVENYFGRYLFVSSQKAMTELGYTPTSLNDAFAASLRWYMQSQLVPAAAARRVRLELRPA